MIVLLILIPNCTGCGCDLAKLAVGGILVVAQALWVQMHSLLTALLLDQ